jgi:hypothetical protein
LNSESSIRLRRTVTLSPTNPRHDRQLPLSGLSKRQKNLCVHRDYKICIRLPRVRLLQDIMREMLPFERLRVNNNRVTSQIATCETILLDFSQWSRGKDIAWSKVILTDGKLITRVTGTCASASVY